MHCVILARHIQAVLAVTLRQQFRVTEFFGGCSDICHSDDVPSVLVHEFEGGLEEVSEFELNKGIEGGDVCVVKACLCAVGADDAIDEVGIGYKSHYGGRGTISGGSCFR